MSAKKIDISDLTKLPPRLMTAKILEKRDEVAKQAGSDMTSALSVWRTTAPIKTGRMRSAMTLNRGKYGATLVPRDSYMKVINSVNKRGKHKGFLDRFKRGQGKSFLQKW